MPLILRSSGYILYKSYVQVYEGGTTARKLGERVVNCHIKLSLWMKAV
jgi:hypothetical protein